MLKKFIQTLLGRGPNSLVPFATLARERTHYEGGVHRCEDFTGVLGMVTPPPVAYRASHSLLGQPPECEILPEGPRYRDAGLASGSPARVLLLDDAGVVTADGIVYCRRTRRAIAETVRQWTAPAARHPVFSAPRFPPARSLPGRTLSLLTLGGEGFYHFLLESVPRLHLARAWLESCDHILVNGAPGGFHEAWWSAAGLPIDRLVWMSGLGHVACEQLIFTDYPMADYRPTPWHAEAVRAVFPEPRPGRRDRRLWISRSDARTRQLTWEKSLLAALPGFEPIVLSSLSPGEQITAISEAAVIAGPHGAGLSHAVFAQPGATIIELFPNTWRQPIYQRLAQVAGCRHAWAVADFSSAGEWRPFAAALTRFIDG